MNLGELASGIYSSELKDYRKWKKTQSVTQKESKGEN